MKHVVHIIGIFVRLEKDNAFEIAFVENLKCVNMVEAANFTLRDDMSALLFTVGSSCNVSAIYFQRSHLTNFSYWPTI